MAKNLIHIKLERSEAIQSKRDVLKSEMDLLKMIKILKRYHSFRGEELQTKIKLHRKLAETKTNMSKLQKILPKMQIPEILKDDEEVEKKPKPKKRDEPYDESIELELQNIQNKLRKLH